MGAIEKVVKMGRGRKRGLTSSHMSKMNGWLKKSAARLRRRLERDLLEDAPKRVTRGWAD